jgi:hypothetical protein
VANGSTGAGYLRIANNEGYARLGTDGGNLLLDVGGSEKVRIDSSGNVGIGTTDPTGNYTTALHIHGSSTGASLHLTDPTSGATATDGLEVFQYGTDGYVWEREAGNLRFGTSATERMRIDASGNVGIGTTSPNYELTVAGGGNNSIQIVSSTTGTGATNGLRLWNTGSSTAMWNYDNTPTLFGTNNAERMRIDSSGNLLVGTTDANISNNSGTANSGINLLATGQIFAAFGGNTANFNRLGSDGSILNFDKDGATVGSIGTASGDLYIGTGNTKLRFDNANDAVYAGGGDGTGTDNNTDLGKSDERFKDLYLSKRVYSGNPTNTAGNLFLHIDGDADGVSTGYKIRSGVGVSTGSSHIAFVNPNGIVGQIRTDGSATSYNTSSDQRLKENIQDAEDAGSKIDAIQVRQFDWKIDGTHESYGVVAQELAQVAPEAVSGNPESEEMMGVDYSKLVPTLIKEIQTLRNRVAQLENN